MPLIDSRGRLFGRVNLIDLLVVVLVVLLVPLGYGAYLLFKQPPAKITGVEPAALIEGKNLSVTVHGENFRAFWLAGVGKENAKAFFVSSPTLGEIKLPDLKPGTYDVTLFDAGELKAKLPNGLTILPTPPPPPPPTTLLTTQVTGSFLNLTKADLDWLKAGAKLPEAGPGAVAEVLAVARERSAERKVKLGGLTTMLPANGNYQAEVSLRLNCTLSGDFCTVGAVPVQAGAVLSLPSKSGPLVFVVEDIQTLGEKPTFPVIKTAKLLGTFEDVSIEDVRALKPGMEFGVPGQPTLARIEEVQAPDRTQVAGKFVVNSIITIKCRMLKVGCWTGEAYLTTRATLNLPHRLGTFKFTVLEARDIDQPVVLPRQVWVRVIGAFSGIDQATADGLTAGLRFPEGAPDAPVELIARSAVTPAVARLKVTEELLVDTLVEHQFQLPAVIRVRCTMVGPTCTVFRDGVVPTNSIRMLWRDRPLTFNIWAVEADVTPTLSQVAMKFVMRTEVAPQVRPGAMDEGKDGVKIGAANTACIASAKDPQPFDSYSSFEMFGDKRIYNQVPEKLVTVDATVQMPLQTVVDGWSYHGQTIKLGSIITVETPKYLIRGWVLGVTPGGVAAPSPCAVPAPGAARPSSR